MSVELWTIDNDDERIEEVIALLRMSLGVAEEAEIVHPETVSALRQWCNSEWRRIHPPQPVPERYPTREQEIMAAMRRSKWWQFWENLTKDQEVRWTGTKAATYFVVDPTPTFEPPDAKERYGPAGMYIELRRSTGKTFWTHIAKVRPLVDEPAEVTT